MARTPPAPLLLLLAACLAHFCSGPSPAQKAARRPAARATTYACPMHPDATASRPGAKCPRCGMSLVAAARPPAESARPWASLSPAERVKELERLSPTYEYACPMHREVRRAQVGDCPKCGMALAPVTPSVAGEYGLKLIPLPARPEAGGRVRLRFVVSHPQTGEPIKQYVLNHERLFHLFVVSRDIGDYQHLHPQPEPDGSFTVEAALPRAGLYSLHSDFFPAGGTPQVIRRELATAGYRAGRAPAPARLTADAELTKIFDGLRVTLDLGGEEPRAGALAALRFRLADARTGEPVRDLEPYLGAWGHTLILNADQSEYLHSHPSAEVPEAADRAALRGGPEVEFKTMFPGPGLYRVWTQFQRAGKVVTASFTLRARPAA